MSSNALLAALLVASASATAQTPPPESGTPAPTPEAAAPATPAEGADSTEERIRQEVDKRMEAARQEMREEIRAQLATQSLANEWQEEWVEEKRKLELFTMDGYLRVRPKLFYNFDLGKAYDRQLFPRSPRATENTRAGADMRVRLEPTFNISEEVRVKVQADVLDNLLLGSTPESAIDDGYHLFDIFSDSQEAANTARRALKDTLQIKEAYGEVSTPVGLLRFGRMSAHWGLGLLRNDGSDLDSDFGDQVDRVMFVTEPFEGIFVTPMFEIHSEGLTSSENETRGEPIDLTNADDSHSWVLAVARRDTPQQVRAKLDNNQGVFNYGLHFSWRTQRFEMARDAEGNRLEQLISRNASLYIPDVWLRYEERDFRVELEAAAIFGSIGNRGLTLDEAGRDQPLEVLQFGGAAVGEYRLLKGQLKLQLELGIASGDKAYGFGALPGRRGSGPGGSTVPGDVDGPQYECAFTGCESDDAIRNFRFNRAYRVDNILWRSLIGTVTDAFYAKPTLRYTLAPGFDIYGSAIYSQALYPSSTPSTTDGALGVETNVGARYETEDGFVAGIDWSVLFPLGGLQERSGQPQPELESAQSIRGSLGIRF
jgi:uncharacterized protein (TIGR04551 family)